MGVTEPVLMDCWTVTLNDLLMDGATPDSDGIVWTVDLLEGWFEPTAALLSRQPVLPVGEVVTAVHEQARLVTLEVTAATPTPDATRLDNLCDQAIETAKTAIRSAIYSTVTMVVSDNVFGDLHAEVRRADGIAFRQAIRANAHSVRFQFLLLAEDPRRYETDLTPHD